MRSPVQSWVALQENPTATQWGFLFEGRSSSLESGRKTKKPRRAQPAGFSTLGLFCRPYQDAEPREAILGAAQPAAKRGNPGNDTSNVIANNFITNNIITNKFIVYHY